MHKIIKTPSTMQSTIRINIPHKYIIKTVNKKQLKLFQAFYNILKWLFPWFAAMTTQLLWKSLSLLTLLCTVSHCVSSKDSQPDPSNPQQGITFSHVYKIDVPGSSSCTLEHLPSQDETGHLDKM